MAHKKRLRKADRQLERHPTDLRQTVDFIVLWVRLRAGLLPFLGIVLLAISLCMIFSMPVSTASPYDLVFIPVIGVVFTSFGAFMLRVASAFQNFEPWAYRYVEFFTQPWYPWEIEYWGVSKKLHRTDVRSAFAQPEYEYPEYPEYGP